MKIETHRIPSSGLILSYQKLAAEFLTLKGMVAAGECTFKSPLVIDLEVVTERDFFEVTGRLSTDVELVCSRCLAAYASNLKHQFQLTYSQKIPKELHGTDSQSTELTADQIGVIYFKGDVIDFSDAVQEQVVMALPYRALCDEACKGLCSQCGADFNRGNCTCDNSPATGPFDVLKGLRLSSK